MDRDGDGRRRRWWLAMALVLSALAAGCQGGPRPKPPAPPTLIPVPDPVALGLPGDPPPVVAIEFKDQIDREAIHTIEQPLPAPGASDHPQPCPQAICQREWIDDDVAWLEVGVYARIGQYHIYQAWYFSGPARGGGPEPPAQIAATVWSGGVACNIEHTHHPYWRIHFDIDGQGKDQVFVRRGAGWALYGKEGDDLKTGTAGAPLTRWFVRRPESGGGVWIIPGDGDGAADVFANRDLSVRRFSDTEDTDWEFDFYEDLGYADGEVVDGQSDVVWYVGHMHHVTSGESRDHWLWHRAGSLLVIQPPR